MLLLYLYKMNKVQHEQCSLSCKGEFTVGMSICACLVGVCGYSVLDLIFLFFIFGDRRPNRANAKVCRILDDDSTSVRNCEALRGPIWVGAPFTHVSAATTSTKPGL